MTTTNKELFDWVNQVAKLTNPKNIHWCDGSDQENELLVKEMVQNGVLHPLNSQTYPNCYLHRSHPSDVARTEHLTFICHPDKEETGPNNNWMTPEEGHSKADTLFKNSMKDRTLYVIPYCMGPIHSKLSRLGVEITDSPYVVANMRIMTRMGQAALKRIEEEGAGSFVKGLHSLGDLSVENRLILHFPKERLIKSIGSGYGGNALLGKKCHSLRIGSYQAMQEGWLAEHMLILGVQDPSGKITYMAAAFPSACGKTNLAMLIPPTSYKGWRIWTVGDDICWMHLNKEDGRLYAINPEAGFFGVAPGTSEKTNPNAISTIKENTIFTNVALTAANEPWWEGKNNEKPVTDWQGRAYDSLNGPAAQPNSRFTVSARQCPSYSPEAENPGGVPISAIIFGGRRPHLVPLIYQAKSWSHGVLMGASVSSETTAAATGQVGVLRHDPMAMKPFCGYNFAHYWKHWLSFEKRSANLPQIFHVNWFRQDKNGKFIWPGFGDNLRVLEWIIARIDGKDVATETPIGFIPKPGSLNTKGLDITDEQMQELTDVGPQGWKEEMSRIREYLAGYGKALPQELISETERIQRDLNS